jgi:hypothetical protein
MEKLKPTTSTAQENTAESPARSIIRTIVRQVLDCVKTAPFGIAITGMGIFNAALYHHHHDYSSVAVPLVIISGGIAIIGKQYQLRWRLEDICRKRGYSDRAFQLTTKEWCDRQTARMAADKHGKLPEYEALCERYRDQSRFTNIQHF